MENLIQERENMNRGLKDKRVNPEYSRITSKIKLVKNRMAKAKKAELNLLRREFRKALRMRNRISYYVPNPL